MNLNRPRRIAAIHDLSGFGRCSLAVICPALSVMGMQVCPVPTAVLSTHTGGLGTVVSRDLTDYLAPTLEHYKSLALEFECVYSGFLAGQAQFEHCRAFLTAYPDALRVVDPVLGDHGSAYRTVTDEMCREMRSLVACADVITPNLTEVALLLGIDYPDDTLTAAQAKSLLVRLSELGPANVVITGATLKLCGGLCNLGYDREHNRFWYTANEHLPVSYPGTGDLFAAVLTGGLLRGDSLPIAMSRAAAFVEHAIRTTYSYDSDPRYGVMFEPLLPELAETGAGGEYHLL